MAPYKAAQRMGLDATVYCDCMERGRLRTPPRPEWQVYIDESGARFPKTSGLEEDLAFDRWNVTACSHEDGVLLHHWLGNMSAVGLIRATLADLQETFPLILSKVVHSGTHCGDHLPTGSLPQLAVEVQALSSVRPAKPLAAEWLRDFEKKMTELLAAANSVGKPISF
jgi:hypothetical protein